MKLAEWAPRRALGAILVCTISLAGLAGNPAPAAAASLSQEEAAMLSFMREEEKLARDVYLFLSAKWGALIFQNISPSEQRHMDTMKKMLDKHGLPDPAQAVEGLFTNLDLQAKYDELVKLGSQSFLEGLFVGASIEEIDLVDLQSAIAGTQRLDLKTAYQNLLEGSKNHLRAFVGNLEAQGLTYEPQLISQDLLDAILGLQ